MPFLGSIPFIVATPNVLVTATNQVMLSGNGPLKTDLSITKLAYSFKLDNKNSDNLTEEQTVQMSEDI